MNVNAFGWTLLESMLADLLFPSPVSAKDSLLALFFFLELSDIILSEDR